MATIKVRSGLNMISIRIDWAAWHAQGFSLVYQAGKL